MLEVVNGVIAFCTEFSCAVGVIAFCIEFSCAVTRES